MKIGILYICTGKYNIFWKDFYLSCEKYFIPESEKQYFVFTDANEIDFEKENKNIKRIYQDNLGWPGNTLKRYTIFLNSLKYLENTDYLFYLNANLLFVCTINSEEFLPKKQESLVACIHPGYYNKPIDKFTYESRQKSKAFLSKKIGKYYFAGGINGGTTKKFIEVIRVLSKNINDDENKNIVDKWHDESHWNRYINNNLFITKIISPSFLYPENANIPFEPKIIIRDKNILGGHSKLRNKTELRLIFNSIKDYIKKIIVK